MQNQILGILILKTSLRELNLPKISVFNKYTKKHILNNLILKP
jgi:hypothetical protein